MKYLESFSMHRELCDRCHQPTDGITIMSMFNDDVICMKCKDEEKKRNDYKVASEKEIDQVRQGNYNYAGAGFRRSGTQDITEEERWTVLIDSITEIMDDSRIRYYAEEDQEYKPPFDEYYEFRYNQFGKIDGISIMISSANKINLVSDSLRSISKKLEARAGFKIRIFRTVSGINIIKA